MFIIKSNFKILEYFRNNFFPRVEQPVIEDMDEISKDDRFSHIGKDPRFRRIPKKEKKVKIDSRFQSMFTDKKFKLKYTVDKRGRPVNKTTSENLKKFYDIDEEEKNDAKSDSEQDEQCDDATTDNGICIHLLNTCHCNVLGPPYPSLSLSRTNDLHVLQIRVLYIILL